MKRFTFQVNEVQTHNMREVGNHKPTEDTITVEADEKHGEDLARSIARTELAKATLGVQKLQPGVLLKVEDVKPKAAPAKPAN